jgi:hypothetical protein
MDSLSSWKSNPWRLHFCSKGHKNIYHHAPAQTCAKVRDGVLPMYRSLPNTSGSISTSIFERHALFLIEDKDYASQLEKDFTLDGSYSSGHLAASHIVSSAFAAVKQQQSRITPSSTSFSAVSAGRAGAPSSALSQPTVSQIKEADLMTKSFAEIISTMSAEDPEIGARYGHNWSYVVLNLYLFFLSLVDLTKAKAARGTRFTHSTEFSQESSASLLVAVDTPSASQQPKGCPVCICPYNPLTYRSHAHHSHAYFF